MLDTGLRRVMNPKRFYKANDSKSDPEVFQVGTVIAGSMEGQANRMTKKERKRTFVDEILGDAGIKKYAGRGVRARSTCLYGRLSDSHLFSSLRCPAEITRYLLVPLGV